MTADDAWMVEAIIQPHRLDAVIQALENVDGFGGVTVTDCRGFGQEKLRTHESPATEPPQSVARRVNDADITDFTVKIKIQCVVAGQDSATAVADAITRAAHTGRRGDGKVFVWPVARVIRIRTLEEGAAGL